VTGGVTGWRTSSYSGSNGDCVEVASWRTSSRSAANGACVEVGQGGAVVAVRDTKDREAGPVLEFPAGAWKRFASRLKADDPA